MLSTGPEVSQGGNVDTIIVPGVDHPLNFGAMSYLRYHNLGFVIFVSPLLQPVQHQSHDWWSARAHDDISVLPSNQPSPTRIATSFRRVQHVRFINYAGMPYMIRTSPSTRILMSGLPRNP